jgi:hypothetical protein
MGDVHHVITHGIGTPADIPHFILVGLSTNPFVATFAPAADTGLQTANAESLMASVTPDFSLRRIDE